MNSITIFLIMVIVGCLISVTYILLKLRSCVKTLNMQFNKEALSRVFVLIIIVMTSFCFGVLITIIFIFKPEISSEGTIRPLLWGIGALLMVCVIVKGIIVGNSIKKLPIDPTNRQLSLAIIKTCIIEIPQLIVVLLFIYRVIG